ncbi:MAG: hypothetical protein EOO42_04205, partial [Flavobacteriales bacterium]
MLIFPQFLKNTIALAVSICLTTGVFAVDVKKSILTDTTKKKNAKEAYIPAKVWRVPDGNDYNDNNSEYSHQRKIESENIVIFWAKEFGDDPMLNPIVNKRFDVKEAIKECERYYNFYVD